MSRQSLLLGVSKVATLSAMLRNFQSQIRRDVVCQRQLEQKFEKVTIQIHHLDRLHRAWCNKYSGGISRGILPIAETDTTSTSYF